MLAPAEGSEHGPPKFAIHLGRRVRKPPKDLVYDGKGWWLHFRNPEKTLKPIGLPDLERALEVLKDTFSFQYYRVREASAGMG